MMINIGNNTKIRLSVIIPFYNSAPFIERCIRSVENQDIPNQEYELICVNDGSNDQSIDIVSRLKKEFENIILINQDNKGVSVARNVGLDQSRGDFLMFVDSDDYIAANTLKKVLAHAEKTNPQVLFLGYTSVKEGREAKWQVCAGSENDLVYRGIVAYFLSRGDQYTDPDRIWAILFSGDFIKVNNLNFLPGVPYLEDGEFMARTLCIAERCNFINIQFYYHTENIGSATRSNLFHSEKATNGFLLAASNLRKYQTNENLNKDQRKFLNMPICKYTILVINSVQKPFSLKRIKSIKTKLRKAGLNKLDLTSVRKEYFWLGLFYNRSYVILILFQSVFNIITSLVNRLRSEI